MPTSEILKDFFFVERGYLNANHFVYRSSEPVLIDTGYHSGFPETERTIRSLGVDPERIRLIVTTHCHSDHVGGHHRIQNRSGCDIAAHQIGKAFIDARDDRATWWGYFGQEAEFFDCTRGLEDGEILALGPHRLRVVHTPGHSADGIVLYSETERILLSSDALWENDIPVLAILVEGSAAPQAMLESMERIERLEVRAVFPGHGRPFHDFREAVARAKGRIRGLIENPEAVGDHLMKRILVFTLLMKQPLAESAFFDGLMETDWYPQTVDHYFQGRYAQKYRAILRDLVGRRVVLRETGVLRAAVKP